MSFADWQAQVTDYYAGRLQEHGPTARGVDWNSDESQHLRFAQLLHLLPDEPCSLLDYGCGYGALLDYIGGRGLQVDYLGFDCTMSMVERAIALHRQYARATFVDDERQLRPCEYVVASGVLNVKLTTPDPEWHDYMVHVVGQLAALSTRGFAFNALSTYSDVDKRRPHLHYADPGWWFDYCKRHISRAVSLLHDYPLYEFTLIVRH
jgi:SAM-dependent methyltransferase